MNISILVVLYNKSVSESVTLSSLLTDKDIGPNSTIVIWNNGPQALQHSQGDMILIEQLKEHFSHIFFEESLENQSLSWIYNQFIDKYSSDKYVILDHDSHLNQTYLSAIQQESGLLLLPKVISQNKLCSPSRLPKNNDRYKSRQHFSAITSGMVLSEQLVHLMQKHYGDTFDSHYAFYGIDTSFMLRMKKLAVCDKITVIEGFEHSLSKNEKESKAVKEFRSRELAISTALTTRHYPSYSSYRRFIKSVFKSIRGKNHYPIQEMFAAFWTGKHPKCRP